MEMTAAQTTFVSIRSCELLRFKCHYRGRWRNCGVDSCQSVL